MKRRTFLKTTAATGAAAAGVGAMTLDAKTYEQVQGANQRVNIAFLGVGGRCQQHIDVILAMQRANANSVRPVAV
ncbi:MAG: twin-arginine translocation signal domain-containing protein, partial [Planctomycetes bacterium]|nr:twin-arginine translocation signal domain-containing protein [Planctomycetota bacterium]